MAQPNRQSSPDIKRSEQYVLNNSFDEEFKVLAFESLGFDGTNLTRQEADDIQVKIVEAGGYTYICKAAAGTSEATSAWKVFRLDSSGNKMFADANARYDNTASDPTILTYSYS